MVDTWVLFCYPFVSGVCFWELGLQDKPQVWGEREASVLRFDRVFHLFFAWNLQTWQFHSKDHWKNGKCLKGNSGTPPHIPPHPTQPHPTHPTPHPTAPYPTIHHPPSPPPPPHPCWSLRGVRLCHRALHESKPAGGGLRAGGRWREHGGRARGVLLLPAHRGVRTKHKGLGGLLLVF